MKILGLEFSSTQRSAAVLDSAAPRAAGPAEVETSRAPPGDGTSPFGLIQTALAQAGVARASIECVAVGLGPGSYAGIRTAIAIAQGWRLARPVRTMGISSVLCLAHQILASGYTGLLQVAIDAQRDDFYVACYRLSPGHVEETGSLRLESRAEVAARLKAGHRVAGPGLSGWFPEAIDLPPSAGMLCQLASAQPDSTRLQAEHLEPICLRQAAFVKAPPPRHY